MKTRMFIRQKREKVKQGKEIKEDMYYEVRSKNK